MMVILCDFVPIVLKKFPVAGDVSDFETMRLGALFCLLVEEFPVLGNMF